MRVIETTAHVGPDGMLRLEVPLDERNQDVRVAVVVESAPTRSSQPERSDDKWAAVRSQLEAAGFRVPPPGCTNSGPVNPIDLPGPSASEMLISDRR